MSNAINRLVLVLLLMMLAAGCSLSPEAKKARHLERADKYFSEGKYREAIIEYKNVIQLDGHNLHGLQQLGLAYYALGEMNQAFPYLVKVKDLDPANLAVRIKLGTLYLLGGKSAEAKEEAEFILEKEHKHFEALLLLADLAATPEEIKAAAERLGELQAEFGDLAKFHLALGTLFLKSEGCRRCRGRVPGSVVERTQLGRGAPGHGGSIHD